jgi:hypothetical protein
MDQQAYFKVKIISAPGDLGCPPIPKVWYEKYIDYIFTVTQVPGGSYEVADGPFKGCTILEEDAERIDASG